LLFREDLRDLTRVQELGQIQVLAELIGRQPGQLVNYSSLARNVNVSVDTVRRWFAVLESLYYSFTVRPWHRNVPKSLRKQPKIYLRDWSTIPQGGARLENFVAAHLLKAVEWWQDIGLGSYGLFYLRDKQKREVDFLVMRDDEPWFLVEAKGSANRPLSPALAYFQETLRARHAFQVALHLPFVDADCFARRRPTVVPARTFLSQLV
jgi:predicted AAA+ superfamily ATPase